MIDSKLCQFLLFPLRILFAFLEPDVFCFMLLCLAVNSFTSLMRLLIHRFPLFKTIVLVNVWIQLHPTCLDVETACWSLVLYCTVPSTAFKEQQHGTLTSQLIGQEWTSDATGQIRSFTPWRSDLEKAASVCVSWTPRESRTRRRWSMSAWNGREAAGTPAHGQAGPCGESVLLILARVPFPLTLRLVF